MQNNGTETPHAPGSGPTPDDRAVVDALRRVERATKDFSSGVLGTVTTLTPSGPTFNIDVVQIFVRQQIDRLCLQLLVNAFCQDGEAAAFYNAFADTLNNEAKRLKTARESASRIVVPR